VSDITARQQRILDFIGETVRERGYPPTVREIGEAVGLTSSSSVHAQLANLERMGLLHKDPTKPRAMTLATDEAKYDEQYNNQPNLTVGRGVLAAVQGADTSAPALEVGCGTGLVSLGLAAHSPYPLTILTDPSPAFLRITQRKMEAAGISTERTAFAVLMGEELDRLPGRDRRGLVQTSLQSAAARPIIGTLPELPMTPMRRVFLRLCRRAVYCYELVLYALLLALTLGVALAGSPAAAGDAQCGNIQSSAAVITT